MILLSAGVLLIIIIIIRIERKISPAAEMQSEQSVRLAANNMISETVSELLNEEGYGYSDLSAVIYDESGKVAGIEAITGNINRLQAELESRIGKKLSAGKGITASIPLGSLYGSYLLAGRGPSVNVRICAAGDVKVHIRSSFTSAGINQTCHSLYAVVEVDFVSAVPLYEINAHESFEYLAAETVIVGEVPQTAVELGSGEKNF